MPCPAISQGIECASPSSSLKLRVRTLGEVSRRAEGRPRFWLTTPVRSYGHEQFLRLAASRHPPECRRYAADFTLNWGIGGAPAARRLAAFPTIVLCSRPAALFLICCVNSSAFSRIAMALRGWRGWRGIESPVGRSSSETLGSKSRCQR